MNNNSNQAQEAIDFLTTWSNWIVEMIAVFSNFFNIMKEAFGNISAE